MLHASTVMVVTNQLQSPCQRKRCSTSRQFTTRKLRPAMKTTYHNVHKTRTACNVLYSCLYYDNNPDRYYCMT